MIDPTDSSGSEDDEGDEVSDLEDDQEDDAEEFGVQDEETKPVKVNAEPGPSRRPPGKNLYAAPTVDEMERLKSAAETGNTFTLQLEALVSSTLLSTTPQPELKAILAKIHDLILGMPELAPLSPRDALKRTPDVPFVGGPEWNPLESDVKWTLGWEKPAEVFVGGSWSVCGGYKKGKGVAGDVDLVVVMPTVRDLYNSFTDCQSMFSPKDRINYRYFHKRSHYIAVVKKAIAAKFGKDKALSGAEIGWQTSMDDRRPVVVIKVGKGKSLIDSC